MSSDARIPSHGRDHQELLAEIEANHAEDIDWRGGRAFSLVYNVGDHDHEELIEQVGVRYLHDNALNPFKYPSVLQMELEVIAMGCQLLNTDPDAGSMSSGGTESIFLAVQVARDHARETRGVAEPQLLTPSTAHPAFAKAAKYLDLEHILVPVGDDGRADVAATEAAITDRTGLIVGSAPCYPYGLIDPIPELAGLALERDILFHTDACLGGWILPWWERLGESVAPWDFRVPGVTSISADIHKYGYTFKGASLVAYKSRDLLKHQFFWYDDWPGGLYASGTAAGTRSAAPIAGAWAAINHLGEDGYLRLTEIVRETTRQMQAGIAAIDGLRVSFEPDLSLFEIGSDSLDMGAVGDVMDDRGWNLDRQQGGLHLMLSPYHAHIVEPFLADLADAARTDAQSRGVEASYGGGGVTRPFLGAVLAGGASRRMGQPKATLPFEGRPMAAHVVEALRAAGARHVVLVGGEPAWAAEVGATHLRDRWPGEGPLGGLATAVGHARPDEVVVVVACDQPDLRPALIASLVEALDEAPAERGCAAPDVGGGAAEALPSAWRSACGPALVDLVDGGARRARSAFDVAAPVLVDASVVDLADIDDPGDLARRLARPADSEAAVDVPEIDIDEAAAKRGGGTPVFDVREPDEYFEGHVPGATPVPLATVPDHVSTFPTQGEALIICRSGARSMKAAEFLRTQGIDAINVAGGTLAWIDAGHEVATGDEPGA